MNKQVCNCPPEVCQHTPDAGSPAPVSRCEHDVQPSWCLICQDVKVDRYRRALEEIRDRWPGLAPHEMAEIAARALKESTP